MKSLHGRLSASFIVHLMLYGAHPGTGAITRATGFPGDLLTGIIITGITPIGIPTTIPGTVHATTIAGMAITIITTAV